MPAERSITLTGQALVDFEVALARVRTQSLRDAFIGQRSVDGCWRDLQADLDERGEAWQKACSDPNQTHPYAAAWRLRQIVESASVPVEVQQPLLTPLEQKLVRACNELASFHPRELPAWIDELLGEVARRAG